MDLHRFRAVAWRKDSTRLSRLSRDTRKKCIVDSRTGDVPISNGQNWGIRDYSERQKIKGKGKGFRCAEDNTVVIYMYRDYDVARTLREV